MVITLTNKQEWHISDAFKETIDELEAFQLLISELRSMPEYTVIFSDFGAKLSIYRADKKIPEAMTFMFRPKENTLAFRLSANNITRITKSNFMDLMKRFGFKTHRNYILDEEELIIPLYDIKVLRNLIQVLYHEIVDPLSDIKFE